MTTRRPARTAPPYRVDVLAWSLIGVSLLALVVEGVHVLTSAGDYHAISDNALNELTVRDLGRHLALLGPFARGGWSHPGPLLFYVLWAPYRVFGSNSSAMLVGALFVNGAAISVMIAIARRWGGFALAAPVALACGLLVVRLSAGFLGDPWNPYLTVLPFGAYLLAAWAATCGDRWALPVAAFIGSFCVQTHIGYAALVGAVALWCVWRAVRDRADPRVTGTGPRGLTALGWAAIVLVVVWAPPVVEQLVRSPGNLGSIVTYFRSPPQPTHSLMDGLRVMGAQFSLAGDWIGGARYLSPEQLDPGTVNLNGQPAALTQNPLPLLLVPFLVACWWSFRRGPVPMRRLAITLLLPIPVGVLALADTIGPMYEYRLRWVWVLAALSVAFTVAVAAAWLRPRLGATARRVSVIATVVVVAALVVGGTVHTADAPAPNLEQATVARDLMRKVVDHLPDRPGVVLFRATSLHTIGYLPAATLALERSGARVKVKNDRLHLLSLGDHRLYRGEPVRALLVFTENGGIERMGAVPGARMVAYEGSASRSRRALALRELRRRWLAHEVSGGHPTNTQLVNRTRAMAVFELAPSGAGFEAGR